MIDFELLRAEAANHPYPLLFATVSGAHLYGFPSPDSDFDLRGAHILPAQESLGLLPEIDFHRQEYESLVAQLETAATESTLPDEPTCRDALNDLLVRVRLRS